MAWNVLPGTLHFDGSDYGRLTLLLSIEASAAACFILEDGARQLRVLLRILHAHSEMMARIAELLAKVEGRDRRIERLVKHLEARAEKFTGEPLPP